MPTKTKKTAAAAKPAAAPRAKRAKPAPPVFDPANSECVARLCADLCYDNKAEAVIVYNPGAVSMLADYYVVCTATSDPHLRALKVHLERGLKEKGIKLGHVSGTPGSHWIILDFGNVLVHVFHEDMRRFYNIEELWGGYPVIQRSPDLE